jgi:hypothetical protein
MGVENPLSPVRNTRQTYNKQLERVITEVQVQFADENPTWIPLETLLAIKSTN